MPKPLSKNKTDNSNEKNPDLTGIITVTRKSVGYVSHPDFKEDVEIAPEELNTALNGDAVQFSILDKKARRTQGHVEKILERKKTEFVGVLVYKNDKLFLVPDDKRVYIEILIPNPKEKVQKDIKGIVKLYPWSDPKQIPEGDLLEILGKKGEHETEMKAIVRGRGFDTDFEKRLEEEAEQIEKKSHITPEELTKRRDFRETTTFTIDPHDAKDFDDALSFKVLPNGDYEVGIHIADVSHYVRPGSAIDKEARKRATSIYLVDRTIPMLPEILSNGVCSLNPNEDKLTYSAVFVLDKNASVKERWFGKTVIHSDKRFTYEEAQEILDNKKGEFFDELQVLNSLANKLQEARFKNGSIDFDQDEISFVLDENGKPLEINRKMRQATNRLVEDFMLLANREVATHYQELCKKIPQSRATFIYRIHDAPNPDKIEELGIFLRAIGYNFETHGGEVTAKDLNKLFKQIEGKPEEHLIKVATIRSMAKAIYSTKNIGHFGLSFAYYTHFTSPIRRYPDIMVHRILKSHLGEEALSKDEILAYESLALQSSRREVEAVEAERESIKLKQVEYMQDHIGESFDGVITGVVEWGIYVEEQTTKAEGLVRVATLGDDFYELDKKNYRLVGNRNKKTYSLGDKIRVRLIAANVEEKTLEWKVVE